MGDRAQVFIKDNDVYLYTHWDGTSLPEIVRTALKKKWRWDDPDYLTRIIFSEMIKDDVLEETGYGIGTREFESRIIEVNCEDQTVKLAGSRQIWFFEDYIKQPKEW